MELTIHDVKSITAQPIEDNDIGHGVYYTRAITITDKDGREFRLVLFSHEGKDALGVRTVLLKGSATGKSEELVPVTNQHGDGGTMGDDFGR